jgi:hypothetical protein
MSFKVIEIFLRIYIADPASSARGHKTFFCTTCNTGPHPLNLLWKRANNITGTTSCKFIEIQTDLVSLKRRSEIY